MPSYKRPLCRVSFLSVSLGVFFWGGGAPVSSPSKRIQVRLLNRGGAPNCSSSDWLSNWQLKFQCTIELYNDKIQYYILFWTRGLVNKHCNIRVLYVSSSRSWKVLVNSPKMFHICCLHSLLLLKHSKVTNILHFLSSSCCISCRNLGRGLLTAIYVNYLETNKKVNNYPDDVSARVTHVLGEKTSPWHFIKHVSFPCILMVLGKG